MLFRSGLLHSTYRIVHAGTTTDASTRKTTRKGPYSRSVNNANGMNNLSYSTCKQRKTILVLILLAQGSFRKRPFVVPRHRCHADKRAPVRCNQIELFHELTKIGQVEVDTPGGESLAFTLRHGDEDGIAVVGFCRENEKYFPDEQECVVTLMQELSSWPCCGNL